MASKEPQRKLLSPSARAISGSENCNPNVIPGSCKRKITKSSTAEQFLESNGAPKDLTSQACADSNLISPPRKHVCSSKRCASKNPDYAVPATANTKKFLASKRHLLSPNGSTVCKCCTRKSKGEDGSANDRNGSMGDCIRCSTDSQKRRWSSDDSVSRNLSESVAFSLAPSERNVRRHQDSGQADHSEQASKSEAAHQECLTDTPKSWSGPDDWPTLQIHQGSISPTAFAYPSSGHSSDSRHQESDFAVKAPYCFEASCLINPTAGRQMSLEAEDDSTPSSMPENEEAAVSPSPEKSGNWRLNAVLQAFGDLSPTREGRVKTLVKAFESLLSVTEQKREEQARKSRCPIKFSYLSSNADLDGEAQTGNFVDGEEGESEIEEARVGQWQTSLSARDVKEEETCDQWQSPVLAHSQPANVEGKEKDGLGKQCLHEQHYVESREEDVNNEMEHGMKSILQKRKPQEDQIKSVVDEENRSKVVGGSCHLKDVVSDTKQWLSQEAEQEDGHSPQEKGEKQLKSQERDQEYGCSLWEGEADTEKQKQDQGPLDKSMVEEDGKEENKTRKLDEEQAEEGKETFKDYKEKAPSEDQSEEIDNRGKQSLENEADNSSASQELERQYVRASCLNPKESASERQPSQQKTHTDLQQRASQRAIDGQFAFKASRKQRSSKSRESLRGSTCSISSTRPPLKQKAQEQYAQDKPRISKPQPFKLLTEARGHIKEQEFLLKLRTLLEEEEKLRVPLAQGLPWTTDEPDIPYKPAAKENTTPWDVQLYSDIRAMERAEFDHFIAEKLLYIEQRRMEEECLRRATEEEEIKKMRHEMVPKAQLMPYFDRPFRPKRSSKRPTIPKEPQFQLNKQQTKRQKCAVANST